MNTLQNTKANLPADFLRLTLHLFLGLFGFVILILLAVLSLALLLTPLGVMIGWYTINLFAWQVDTIFEAILMSGLSLPGGLFAWFMLRGMACLFGPARN